MISEELGWCVSYDGLILRYNGREWQISDSLNNLDAAVPVWGDTVINRNINFGDIYTIRMLDDSFGWFAANNVYSRIYSLWF